MRSSRVVRRDADQLVVEQTGEFGFLCLQAAGAGAAGRASKSPQRRVVAHAVGGNLKEMEGRYTVESLPAGTVRLTLFGTAGARLRGAAGHRQAGGAQRARRTSSRRWSRRSCAAMRRRRSSRVAHPPFVMMAVRRSPMRRMANGQPSRRLGPSSCTHTVRAVEEVPHVRTPLGSIARQRAGPGLGVVRVGDRRIVGAGRAGAADRSLEAVAKACGAGASPDGIHDASPGAGRDTEADGGDAGGTGGSLAGGPGAAAAPFVGPGPVHQGPGCGRRPQPPLRRRSAQGLPIPLGSRVRNGRPRARRTRRCGCLAMWCRTWPARTAPARARRS